MWNNCCAGADDSPIDANYGGCDNSGHSILQYIIKSEATLTRLKIILMVNLFEYSKFAHNVYLFVIEMSFNIALIEGPL